MVEHRWRKVSAAAEVARGVWMEEVFEIRPALCVDFDGTIRRSKTDPGGFVLGAEDLELIPGSEEKLWEYRNAGYLVFGVTNQGGVAFGYKTPADAEEEMARTISLFRSSPFHGAKLCYNAPLGTIEPFNHRSLLRKPDVGMLALLEQDAFVRKQIVDWDRSLMVGDREEDRELAVNARIAFRWADEFFGRVVPDGQLPLEEGP